MNLKVLIFDWKRTLYNPDTKELEAGAKEILKFCNENGFPLYLVGKGGRDMHAEVGRLGISGNFVEIVFWEGAKEDGVFKQFMSSDPRETLFIGDRIQSELALGKSLGATTLWVRQGKFSDEMPATESQNPDYTVSTLKEAGELLTKLFRTG
jgi:ribonucleotide monophosphatase NagD (HAD superfamily)